MYLIRTYSLPEDIRLSTNGESSATDATARIWFVYLLECANGRLYTGITPDLARRFAQHRAGKGALFTKINVPLRMLAAHPCVGRAEASRMEYRIKQLSAAGKRRAAADWLQTHHVPGTEDSQVS